MIAARMQNTKKSFIREILKVTAQKEVISFAGGLPNACLFPTNELAGATIKSFANQSHEMLQYGPSEGYLPLRQFIAHRYYKRFNLNIDPKRILILNGSQQGLDIIGKVLINPGDRVIIEEPGYLGAIQAFSMYQPLFKPVPLTGNGISLEHLEMEMKQATKLFYAIPNFQNPSGISYSENNRRLVAKLIKDSKTYLIEDDPYGELRFGGKEKSSFAQLCPDQTILLGSFSKIVVPGFRIGWIVMPEELTESILIAKQAADLHTNYLAQKVLFQYLSENMLGNHIALIRDTYGAQAKAMMGAIRQYFPKEVSVTQPEGGMFLWVTLPERLSAMELFRESIKERVAFVPGSPFYIHEKIQNTLRLNYSCTSPETIETGIKTMGKVLCMMMAVPYA